jgi:phosphate transport system permease protein
MTVSKSFTGRSRQRRTHWLVRVVDRLAKLMIVGGGIGTIVAVLLVCVFLFSVALPLLLPCSVSQPTQARLSWLVGKPLHLAVGERQQSGWILAPDGKLHVFRLDAGHLGELLETREVFSAGLLTAASFSIDSPNAAFGFSDGTVRMGKLGFKTSFLNEKDIPSALRTLTPGQLAAWDGGLVECTPEGQLRLEKMAVELQTPLPAVSASPIVRIDHTIRPTGPMLATLSADGTLTAQFIREQKNMMTGRVDLKANRVPIPYKPPTDRALPNHLLVSGVGDDLYLAWEDGQLWRFDLRDIKKPKLAESLDLVPEPDRTLTALGMLVGKTTLVAGDAAGRIEAWFKVRKSEAETTDGSTLLMAHPLSAGSVSDKGSAVTSLAASARTRTLAAGGADGMVKVFYVTNENLLVEAKGLPREPVESIAFAPQENALVGLTAAGLCRWETRLEHSEVTVGSLLLPVWYEGYDAPECVWQSTGGTDDFEPKLGLWPLMFGTLKATFYSLLFGVPLALLAAVYSSEFLHPRVRARIKPTIELMASLPSVVLGFLAAQVFAPQVAHHLPAVLTSLAAVPLAFLFCGFLWQLLPSPARVVLSRWRFIFIFISLFIGPAAAIFVGPWVERVLFAGDIRAWLDGQAGSGIGGWIVLLLPLTGVASAVLISTYVNPKLNRLTSQWSALQGAAADLLKFFLGAGVAVLAALLFAELLDTAGWDPRGSIVGTYVQRNALVVGFVMGFAIIPLIYTIAEDALSSVPAHLRSASLGAGATPWQTAMRIIIPTAMSGLFSAVMIGLGRAVGETMIMLMAAGNTPMIDLSPFDGFRTLSANIATELPEAVPGSTHFRVLFLTALLLFGMTFVLNTAAEVVRQRFRKRAYQL